MWFEKCRDLNELKSVYRKLALQYHPDVNKSDNACRIFQEINQEYDRIFLLLKAKQNYKAADDVTGRTKRTTETPSEFREIVSILLKLDGIEEVELCGSWVWISGHGTFQHKEALKAVGCRWSRSKKKWYWHHVEDDCHWSRGTATMSEIRSKYGSEWLRSKDEKERVELPA